MRRPSKLRVRFALWTTALFFASVLLYGTFVFATMYFFLHASVRDSLRFSAGQVVASLEIEGGKLNPPEHLGGESAYDYRGGLVAMGLLDPQGRPLVLEGRAASLLPAVAAPPHEPYFQATEPDLAVYTVPVAEGGAILGIVQVAQSTETIERMLKELLIVLAGSLPFFLVGSAASGYFLAGRLLEPIDAMTRTAHRFSEEDLSARIGLPGADDELGRLAATFDEMLARIEDSFTRYRQFTADASHELRTPVSVIQAILAVTQRRPRSVEEYRGALDDLAAAADRLATLVAALMTLSRSDLGAAAPLERVDAGDLVSGVVESLRPLAEGKGLELVAELPPALATSGDSDALIHVFINVIENAIKYSERGRVTVRGRSAGDAIEIEVEDTGIGIAEEHLPRIFDRFYRVERARSASGSGLGLSIARAIVERHRGSIEASSAPGVGTKILIRLPPA